MSSSLRSGVSNSMPRFARRIAHPRHRHAFPSQCPRFSPQNPTVLQQQNPKTTTHTLQLRYTHNTSLPAAETTTTTTTLPAAAVATAAAGYRRSVAQRRCSPQLLGTVRNQQLLATVQVHRRSTRVTPRVDDTHRDDCASRVAYHAWRPRPRSPPITIAFLERGAALPSAALHPHAAPLVPATTTPA